MIIEKIVKGFESGSFSRITKKPQDFRYERGKITYFGVNKWLLFES